MVEAAMTLPVFILAAAALAMIVQVISACETISFITSCEMKRNLISESNLLNTVSLCRSTEKAADEQCPQTDLKITNVRAGYTSGGIQDLVSMTAEADFQIVLPAGIGGAVTYEQKLTARLFTGSRRTEQPLELEAFHQSGPAQEVVIYPRYGERYHIPACIIVKQQNEAGNRGWNMDLEEAQMQGFSACILCRGGTG